MPWPWLCCGACELESRLIGKLEVARAQVFRVVSQIKAVTSEHRHHVQMMRTIAGQFGAAVKAANRLREDFQGEYREAYEEEAARLLQQKQSGEGGVRAFNTVVMKKKYPNLG